MPSLRAERPASYDVAIVGGGPAGAATALALRRADAGVRVALVERSDYATFRVGETLPPPARRLLTELGVWDAFPTCGVIGAYGTRAAWGSGVARDHSFIFSPFGRGWHVDRRAFDAWLAAEAARAGAEVFRNARAEAAARHDGEWTMTVVQQAGATGEIRARVLVDATGRHSRIARGQGARHIALDRLVGVAARLRVQRGRVDTYTEVEACPHGWWYTAMLPDGHLLAIVMIDADRLRRAPWRTVDARRAPAGEAPLTAERIADAVPVETRLVCPESSQRLDRFAGEGWLAAGDAPGTVDPLSSQGVMRALRSESLPRAIHGSRPAIATPLPRDARLAREFDAYLETRHAYYAVEQRWPESPFWRRRHTSVVTGGGTAHAVQMENQHHEESQAGSARRLHV